MSNNLSLLMLTAGLLAAGLAQAGPIYNFTTVDDPSAQFYPQTYANALNNAGVIVGNYSTSEFNYTGFMESGGTFSNISDTYLQLGTETNKTYPYGINNSGVIVGAYNNFFGTYGFVDNGGTFSQIGVPGAFDTYATGINDSGLVAGYSFNATTYNGFVDDGGTFTTVNDPNAGASYGQGTFAWSINNSGVVVGYYIDSNNIVHGFVEQNGTFMTLDDPNASQVAYEGTYVLGINNLGQIVGYYVVSGLDAGLDYHGFLYSNGSFTTIDDPEQIPQGGTEIYGINDAGDLVGNFTCSTCGDNYQGFFAAPNAVSTPEPATFTLLLVGLLMIKFFHRGYGYIRCKFQARTGGN